MSSNITILDQDYKQWLQDLSSRYRNSQLKAAVKVNKEMLQFYWSLGRDIVEMHAEERWGEKVIRSLSRDLRTVLPDAHCFSKSNLYYMKRFYEMYSGVENSVQQAAGQTKEPIAQQPVGQIQNDIFSIPWGHHILIMNKCIQRWTVSTFRS